MPANNTQASNVIIDDEAIIHCKNCGNLMVFDPSIGGMHCDACGGSIKLDLTTGAGQYEELSLTEDAVANASHDWGQGKVAVKCKTCGAETVFDAFVKSQVCPFCGSSLVIEQTVDLNSIAPTHVIPFKVSIKEAGILFKNWLKRKFFVPGKCKKSANPKNIKGLYMPFWTFDTDTFSQYTARRGVQRTVTRTNSKGETETEIVVDWYPVNGDYRHFFDDVLISASRDSDTKIIRKIEPFDFAGLLPFSSRYLSGFLAERYTINLKDGWSLAQERIQGELSSLIESDIKSKWRADLVDSLSFSTDYYESKFKHVLLPLWLSSYTYRNKTYHFIINGQTGKVGGKSPVSMIKVMVLALAILAAVSVAIFIISRF